MAIKRYTADADNVITNAYEENLSTRATGSNMGLSDVLEVFSVYAQADATSTEYARSLVKFPISSISTDRTAGTIPATGSVSFYLRMFNAEHSETLPKNFKLVVEAISSSWDEGHGLDMDTYTHSGTSNWISASSTAAWTSAGGDFHSEPYYTASFDDGTEDLELDITALVEQWIAGTKSNYGLGVKLTSSHESETRSYYTKKFFARGSQYFFKRPIIEARWNSAKKDDRTTFYYSSSLAPAADNLNTLYLYNYVRGRLRNIPGVGTGNVYVSLYSGSSNNVLPDGDPLTLVADGTYVRSGITTVATGGYVETGIYSASLAITSAATPLTKVFDVWFSGGDSISGGGVGGGTLYHTGSIVPTVLTASVNNPSTDYVTSITNLKPIYKDSETARIRVYTRTKDWNPNIYSKAVATAESRTIESGSYQVYRLSDGMVVVPYGTGSLLHTQMSYDVSGNYFDFDMSMLQQGYAYAFQFAYYNGAVGDWLEQPEFFKFRVE